MVSDRTVSKCRLTKEYFNYYKSHCQAKKRDECILASRFSWITFYSNLVFVRDKAANEAFLPVTEETGPTPSEFFNDQTYFYKRQQREKGPPPPPPVTVTQRDDGK